MQHWLRGGRDGIADDAEATAEAMRGAGVPEHLIELQCAKTTDFPLWPENVTPIEVWRALAGTQWNIVAGGMGTSQAIGLRYETLPVVMDLLEVPADERRDTFDALRVMERVALKHYNAPPKR